MNMTQAHPTPETRWQQPARQAQVAMVFIGLKYLRRALRQAWPLFIIVVLRNGQGERFTNVLYLALIITGLQLITSIIAWFRYTFYVQNDELVVSQGLFRRKRSSIPLPRIQSLQFSQNLLHRRLGVVAVEVETAGSQGTELSIDALEKDRAEDLRRFIMARKADLQPELEAAAPEAEADFDQAEPSTQAATTPLLRLTPRVLLYAGLTRNHLRTAGLIIGGLLGLYQLAGDVFPLMQPDQMIERLIGVAPTQLWQSTLLVVVALGLAAVVGSLIQTALRFFDLRLESDDTGFHLQAGLLNRREELMRHEKLQYLRSLQNPLQAQLRLRTLQLVQVGGNRAARQSMQIPGGDDGAWERARTRMFGEAAEEGLTWSGIHPRIVRRYLIQLGIIPALIGTGVLWINVGPWALLALPWIGVGYLLGLRYYRTFRYGLNHRVMRVTSALFLRSETELWLFKAQAVELSQNWIQRRHDLASVTLHMATGGVNIPYLPLAEAERLRDLVLYRVEVSEEDWM